MDRAAVNNAKNGKSGGRELVYADPHFGHANIIAYCQRPFPSVDKMDGELVKLYNSVVTPKDTVYWLGDVTLRGADRMPWLRRILGKMNGTKILVFGNHDRWHWDTYLEAGFQSVHSFFHLWPDGLGGSPISLCHDPSWAQDKTSLWICGHMHNNAFEAGSHIVVVSVELTDYKPIPVNAILEGWRPK